MAKTMKQLFDEKKKYVIKANLAGRELDKMIEDRWGFHYSSTDDDPIIDTLDYGTNSISYKDFVDRMNQYKSSLESNGKFVVIP